MAEAKSRDAWQHTSAVLCLIANVNRNPKKQARPFSPDQFNPHAQKRRGKGRTISVHRLFDDLMEPVEGKKRRG